MMGVAKNFPPPRRVLIYRLGSIGDTMVAMPSLRLIERAFPDAARILLTGETPPNGESMETLLAGSGLVHQFISYRPGERSPRVLWRLSQTLRALRVDLLVYLTEPRGGLSVWRDIAFFSFCGIRRIVGAPVSGDLRRHRKMPDTGLWESEGARLARCIRVLGSARLDDAESWRPCLTEDHHAAAERILAAWPAAPNFIALAVGIRVPAKDWGEDNWAALIRRLEDQWPGLGILLIGGPLDQPRIRRLIEGCRAPVLDRCGCDLRVTMALLSRSRLLVATESGPMHLGAALGVPTVAMFFGAGQPDDRFPDGDNWFPNGDNHSVLCARAITVDTVMAACVKAPALGAGPGDPPRNPTPE